MATYVQEADGAYNDDATWAGTGTPGSTDTAQIVDTLTCTITSGFSQTAGAIQVQGGGTLVGTGGQTLTLAGGNLTLQNDASTKCGNLGHTGTGAFTIHFTAAASVFSATGIDATHRCQLIGGSNANHIKITNNAVNGAGQFRFQQFAMQYWGNSSTAAISSRPLATSSNVYLLSGTLDNCGAVAFSARIQAAATGRIENVTTTNTQGTYTLNLLSTDAITSGTRNIAHSVFDKGLTGSYYGFTITTCFIGGQCSWSASGAPAQFDDCFIYKTSAAAHQMWAPSDSYIVNDNVDNPHFVDQISGQAGTYAYDGDIFEHLGTQANGDCVLLNSGGSAITVRLLNCIVQPNAGGGISGTQFSALGGNTDNKKISVDHCSGLAGVLGFIAVGETNAGFADRCEYLKNTLAVGTSASATLADTPGTPADGYITTAHNNGIWNITGDSAVTDPYVLADAKFGSTPGTGDVYENPDFAGDIFNAGLAAFDSANGGPGTAANCITEFMKLNDSDYDSAYNVTDLLAFARAKWAPTNASFDGAADDAGTIGAVPYAAPASGFGPLIGGLRNHLARAA